MGGTMTRTDEIVEKMAEAIFHQDRGQVLWPDDIPAHVRLAFRRYARAALAVVLEELKADIHADEYLDADEVRSWLSTLTTELDGK
jgi:hypothetical protein